ncbi:hypothetical protein D8882_06800 [Streptococcus sanguinis]|jgi:hypothetical protein|uniref:Lipoprotein n=1 Tax=Streptococcus sanguinis SK49 TaxID=888808 RepID=F3UY79_STRSA|nr:hypothetical protein [Streptococcus sanguinis]EGJ38196.1 lipoprotein [Streptococcus sanguinis SK49]RSI18574.1 hypothetical protein D8882_06800 [Streptococcus sanguinis]RSJ39552.1 hypothetical protein D8820_08485 [Streptococcus sanguinis]
MVKKGKIATLSIVAIAVTLVIGGTIMTVQNQNLFTDGVKREKKKEQDSREQQLAYLKKHKKDIEEYIKSLNPKIETVQIDWDQTQWDQIGNGTPQGGGDIVQVYGGFNNMAKSSWSVIIRIEDEKILINSIGIGSPLRIGGELFE